jgi:hypothetical protein
LNLRLYFLSPFVFVSWLLPSVNFTHFYPFEDLLASKSVYKFSCTSQRTLFWRPTGYALYGNSRCLSWELHETNTLFGKIRFLKVQQLVHIVTIGP